MDRTDRIVRETISGKVSVESHNGWRKFCLENGISMSGLLEVAGRRLGQETFPPTVPERMKMVEEARRVDMERRARRPKSG